MIKVVRTSDPLDDTRRLIHSINYSEAIHVVSVVFQAQAIPLAPGAMYGGLAVDRSVFRKLMPDARWLVYAAGWINPLDAAGGTVEIVYEKDNAAVVVLGTTAMPGAAGLVKMAVGPFDVFNTATVPQTEIIPIITLKATKAGGVPGALRNWCMWFRFLAPKQ